ncbi:MAG: PASTA domain-containing protein, partial [Oscillospiraceae bacterium]|nr:PASTA domain-containing protein [Oscillospiraceae bacterium]
PEPEPDTEHEPELEPEPEPEPEPVIPIAAPEAEADADAERALPTQDEESAPEEEKKEDEKAGENTDMDSVKADEPVKSAPIPAQNSKKSSGAKAAAIILGILAAALLALCAFLYTRPATVTVGQLEGMDYGQVKSLYGYEDIDVRLADGETETEGVIVGQSVQPGEQLEKGQPLYVWLESPAEPEPEPAEEPPVTKVTVPDFTGCSYDTAIKLCRLLGLELTVATNGDVVGERQNVLGQEPAAGTELDVGSTLTLTVSSLPQPEPPETGEAAPAEAAPAEAAPADNPAPSETAPAEAAPAETPAGN